MALLTLDELGGYQRTFGGDEGNSNPDYSDVPAEQRWLAMNMMDPEQLRVFGNYYLGRPILTDADFNQAFVIMKSNLVNTGQRDPTGIFGGLAHRTALDKATDAIGGTFDRLLPQDDRMFLDPLLHAVAPNVGQPSMSLDQLPVLGAAAFGGAAASGALGGTLAAEGAGVGVGEAATGSVASTLPDSYWSMTAGGGTASDAAAVNAGTVGGSTVDTGFFPDILGGATSDYLPPITGELGSTLPAVDTATGYLTPGLTEAGLASGFPEFETLSSAGLTGDNLSQLAKLLGNGQNSSIFGNRGILGTGLALAPALAAIQYARNQGPFDTSRLQSAYNQIDPNALALPFDLQTARGRENLSSSLTQRNVMGSSFGNQDLASYDLLRQAGRQNILTQGAQAQAGIGGQILDAQVKERLLKNDLYGRALLALSTGLNPPQTNTNVGGVPQTGSSTNDILKILGGAGSLYSMFA